MARNPGSAKKATSYAERLRLGIAVIHGEQKESETDEVDGRNSPPLLPKSRTMDVSGGVPVHPAKEKPPINVVGDVGGRIAIMVVCRHAFNAIKWLMKRIYFVVTFSRMI